MAPTSKRAALRAGTEPARSSLPGGAWVSLTAGNHRCRNKGEFLTRITRSCIVQSLAAEAVIEGRANAIAAGLDLGQQPRRAVGLAIAHSAGERSKAFGCGVECPRCLIGLDAQPV